jgi:hypothetical protein
MHPSGTKGGHQALVPWWVAYADAAEAWHVAPWEITERQAEHGDALEWVRRAQTLARARRDAG